MLTLKPAPYDDRAKSDLAKAARVTGHGPDYYEPEIKAGSCRILGGYVDGERVVSIAYEVTGSTFWIAGFGGAKAWRDRFMWVDLMEQYAMKLGCCRVAMASHRPGICTLYAMAGYSPVCETRDGSTEYAKQVA